MFKILFGSILSLFMLTAQAVPQVMVTIKPIHSLVAGVMQNVGTPQLLLTGGESPHTYNLRPSQMQQLSDSALIIWVGPGVETFLVKSLGNFEATKVLQLTEVMQTQLLRVREGGSWEKHSHDHEDAEPGDHHDEDSDHDVHEHHHAGAEAHNLMFDQHIWLNPQHAKSIVTAVANKLSDIDPANATHYQENAKRLQMRLDQLDADLQQKLHASRQIPYLVFHDAYQYLEQHYGLTAVGSITLSPENPPSAKRIQQLRNLMKKLQVRCVFSEPQFEPKIVNTLLEGSTIARGVLDPIGATLTAGTEAYFELMRTLADNLNVCLNS
jgi:zinc transport system substrate-binding protein